MLKKRYSVGIGRKKPQLEPDRRTDPGPKGVLARVYRQMYNHLVNQSNRNMKMLMTQFIEENCRHGTVKGSAAQNKSNLIDEFNRPTMTWAVFCKVLRFFKFARVEIVFRCYDSRGRFYDYTHNMNLTNPHEEADEDGVETQGVNNDITR